MSHLISEQRPITGMTITGFIASVITERDGLIVFGLFSSRDEAHAWAKNLEGIVSVSPVYQASWNRG